MELEMPKLSEISAGPESARARGVSLGALAIAAAVLVLHLATNMRYGLHRDELQVLSDALHLDWGYVAYPPLTPFVERVAHGLFGWSLVGLRLFSALAQAAIIVAAAQMTRVLGGSRLAQTGAALAVALSAIALFEGTEFQYSSFEQFAWVMATYGVVRLLVSEDERWCLWIGGFAGLGLLSKYTVVLFIVALLAGFLLTPARRLMASRWFVLGCGLTLLMVLPNVVWQVRHNFISLHFLQHIHARDVRIGRGTARQFWLGQTLICANPFALPLWIAGTVVALLLGFLLSPARRLMASRWFVLGCGLTLLIVLPNVVWQVRHDFISLHFLQHIHARDVRIGRGTARQFWLGQTLICANPFALPLWIAGTVVALRSVRLRALGWAFVLTVALLAISRGRGYYQAAAFPVMISVGAVAASRWLAHRGAMLRRTVLIVWFTGIVACGAYAAAMLVPIASSGPLRSFALKSSEDLREEIGWEELVQQVAAIRDSLPAAQQQSVGVLASNYGEAGAVEVFGPRYHLPPPINWTNSGWLRGYPTPQPTALIVLGLDRETAEERFTGCRLAGHEGNREGVVNEESRYHPEIFVCGPPRLPWPEFWRQHRNFG